MYVWAVQWRRWRRVPCSRRRTYTTSCASIMCTFYRTKKFSVLNKKKGYKEMKNISIVIFDYLRSNGQLDRTERLFDKEVMRNLGKTLRMLGTELYDEDRRD